MPEAESEQDPTTNISESVEPVGKFRNIILPPDFDINPTSRVTVIRHKAAKRPRGRTSPIYHEHYKPPKE